MTILSKSKLKKKKIDIDLSGPHGNAYWLMAQAKVLCEQLGVDFTRIEAEMKSGNYENLIFVFEREFGKYVNLYR